MIRRRTFVVLVSYLTLGLGTQELQPHARVGEWFVKIKVISDWRKQAKIDVKSAR